MENSTEQRKPLNVFYFYDLKDDDVVKQIEKHCLPLEQSGKIKIWHQDKITGGQVIEIETIRQLNQAEIIIFMLSADLLVSDLFHEVERISIERTMKNQAILIPVYLKPCLFTGYDFNTFKMIPSDGEPVVKVGLDLTERCNNVALEIHNLAAIEEFSTENNTSSNTLQKSPDESINILYLVNDPDHLKSSLANKEINSIKHRLLIGKCSCKYELIPKNIKTLEDFQRAMLEVRPSIVHFSGYATQEDKLVFQDHTGEVINIEPSSLCKLFTQFSDKLELVILNACYSKLQAESIVSEIKYVVGIEGGVDKVLSMDFVNGFYQALSYGTSIKKAFALAINLLELKNQKYAEDIILLEQDETPLIAKE